MDTSAINYKLFMLSRSLARDTSSLVNLFDKYRSSQDSGHLRESSAIGCRSLKGLRDVQLAEILETLYTPVDKSKLSEAKGCFENRAAFDEFLEVEYALLRLVGTSKEAAEIIIGECRRLQRVALQPQNSRLLLNAFELLEKSICGGEEDAQFRGQTTACCIALRRLDTHLRKWSASRNRESWHAVHAWTYAADRRWLRCVNGFRRQFGPKMMAAPRYSESCRCRRRSERGINVSSRTTAKFEGGLTRAAPDASRRIARGADA